MYTEANTCLYTVKWVYTRRQTHLHENANAFTLYLASDLYCTLQPLIKDSSLVRTFARSRGNILSPEKSSLIRELSLSYWYSFFEGSTLSCMWILNHLCFTIQVPGEYFLKPLLREYEFIPSSTVRLQSTQLCKDNYVLMYVYPVPQC